MFYEQLKKACYVRGTTPTAITKELEITSANTGKWKNGGNPTVENLIKIAKLLEVTTDYLLGLDDTIATSLSANKNPADEERQGAVHGGDVIELNYEENDFMLTQNAMTILKRIYDLYKLRCKETDIASARKFETLDELKLDSDNGSFGTSCIELEEYDFVSLEWIGKEFFISLELRPKGIAYMESFYTSLGEDQQKHRIGF